MVMLVIVLLGLCAGSFINALVWRIHEQAKSKVKQPDLSILKGRSMCPACKHTLGVRDLMPLLSWIILGGRCRYCRKPIGWQYPIVEILTAGIFFASYTFWPYNVTTGGWVSVVLWLGSATLLIALAVYDTYWMLLPNRLVYPLYVFTGLLVASLAVSMQSWRFMGAAAVGGLLLSGMFYLLYQVSEGKWIGGGDVKLAVALGALAGGLLSSVLLLFLASLMGSIVGIPMMIKSHSRKRLLPFGPFLIIATFVVFLWGQTFIDAYLEFVGM